MNLSLKDYYDAVDIMRTVDDCEFAEQYFEGRDGRRPYLYATLVRSVSHDLAPVAAARFAELAVLVGGHLSMFHFKQRCELQISVSADIPAQEVAA